MLNKLLLVVILLINIAILVLLYAANPNVISDAFGSGSDDSGLAKDKSEPGAPSGNDSAAAMDPQPDNNSEATAALNDNAPLAAPESDRANNLADDNKQAEQKTEADKGTSGENSPKSAEAKLANSQPNPASPGNSSLESKPTSALYEEFPGFYDTRSALRPRNAALY